MFVLAKSQRASCKKVLGLLGAQCLKVLGSTETWMPQGKGSPAAGLRIVTRWEPRVSKRKEANRKVAEAEALAEKAGTCWCLLDLKP